MNVKREEKNVLSRWFHQKRHGPLPIEATGGGSIQSLPPSNFMDLGVVDQIKQKLDVVEVLGEYLKLTKVGRNYKARCPFHAEKTPSFMVSPERQSWHCFGCNEGGDIFSFVMKMEGMEFGDALRILARKAGVQLQRQNPQVQSQKKRLYDLCELAARYFEVQLEKSAEGQNIQKYLLGRGLKPETIKEWRLGWARNEWRSLSDFLRSRGYTEREMLAAGLIIEKDSSTGDVRSANRYYDRFRSRIIFPIFDIQGQVIAFGGRIFGDDSPDAAKYLNSPQTTLYDKGRVLYGLNSGKTDIRQKDFCILVEGYMDLLMSWQAGVKNVVASSGTALTEEQLKLIGRYTKNISMAFDSDIAGDTATKRSIELALVQDFNIKIIQMADKDPADVVKKNPADWVKIVESAGSVMDFYFSSAFGRHDGSMPEGRKEILKMILPVIKSIASRTEQSEWLTKLAAILRVNEKDLVYDLARVKTQATAQSKAVTGPPVCVVKSRQEGLEERFLGLCLNNPQKLSELSLSGTDFNDERFARIFSELQVLMEKKKGKDVLGGLRRRLSPELNLQLDYISLKIEQIPADEMEMIAEMETCLKELKVLKLRRQLTALSFDIKDAQGEGNKQKLRELLENFSQLSSQLIELTR